MCLRVYARWRPHSMFRYESFGHKHRTRTIYKSALWTDGTWLATFTSKTRDPVPRRSDCHQSEAAILYENEVIT